jgi:MFS family permease
MLKEQTQSIFGIEKKFAFKNAMIVANPLIWYAVVLMFLQDTATEMALNNFTSFLIFLIWCVHFSTLILSALAGVFLTKRIGQNRFLTFWILLGVISSLLASVIGNSSVSAFGLLALLFGISLGFGMPTCMRYYTDRISVEKRGRVSGIVMLLFGIGISAFSVANIGNSLVLGVVLAIWRLSSLIFLLPRTSNTTNPKPAFSSYKNILRQQSFILYLIPWVMFSLVNYLSTPLQSHLLLNLGGEQFNRLIMMAQNALIGIFAVIGGFLLDSFGRKRVAIAGFVLFGLGTATLGLFPENLFSAYFSVLVDGIGWGFLFVLFVLTIWGDLSHNASSDKYYAIGMLPFFVSKFLELTVGGYIAAPIPNSALFSFAAFFLFLAVLPLFYAPETLPEKQMKERDLKSYVEKAQKIKEKYA